MANAMAGISTRPASACKTETENVGESETELRHGVSAIFKVVPCVVKINYAINKLKGAVDIVRIVLLAMRTWRVSS